MSDNFDWTQEVTLRKDEPIDVALKRFKKLCQKNGILQDIKRHQFYEKPSERKKKKMQDARKREFKRLRKERMYGH